LWTTFKLIKKVWIGEEKGKDHRAKNMVTIIEVYKDKAMVAIEDKEEVTMEIVDKDEVVDPMMMTTIYKEDETQ